MGFEKILCPIDFSEPSRDALRFAAEAARDLDAALTLINAYQVPVVPLPDGSMLPPIGTAELFDNVDRALGEWRGEAVKLGAKRVDTIAAAGIPWRAVVEQASVGKHDLLIVGTHGRTGIARALIGSVAERIVREAPCPVLTVRGIKRPWMEIRKILCPIDFSEPSRKAFTLAAKLAAKIGASITLLHVYQVPEFAPGSVHAPTGDSIAEFLEKIDEALESWLPIARELGVSRVTIKSAQGTPWSEIVQQADEGDFDLIAIGTHGRTGLDHMLLGSVAERVVRHAPCSVLSVRPLPPRR